MSSQYDMMDNTAWEKEVKQSMIKRRLNSQNGLMMVFSRKGRRFLILPILWKRQPL